MARKTEYTFNNSTGKWDESSSEVKNNSSNKDDKNNKYNKGGSNLTNSTSDSKSSKGSVEKKYNDIEVNTLNGTLNFICTETTIKLKAGDTVNLKGFGSHLSGKYYVKDVTRTVSSSGYSHSATVIKTDFGKLLKSSSTSSKKISKKIEETVTTAKSPNKSQKRTYTVKKGDTLWKIAKQFYGNGALYTKIYDANTGKVANQNLIYVGQTLVIP